MDQQQLIQLAIKALVADMDTLKSETAILRLEVSALKKHQIPAISTKEKEGNKDELLTLLEACAILGISRSSFIRLVNDGIIKPVKINLRTLRYSRNSLMEFIENGRK